MREGGNSDGARNRCSDDHARSFGYHDTLPSVGAEQMHILGHLLRQRQVKPISQIPCDGQPGVKRRGSSSDRKGASVWYQKRPSSNIGDTQERNTPSRDWRPIFRSRLRRLSPRPRTEGWNRPPSVAAPSFPSPRAFQPSDLGWEFPSAQIRASAAGTRYR